MFPKIKTLQNEGSFAEHMKDAIFMIPSAKLLDQVVQLLSAINMDDKDTKGDVLDYARQNSLCMIPERLSATLDRKPRTESYDKKFYSDEKFDWLADNFLSMTTNELISYFNFISDYTPLSTQHGPKGEEYEDVLVVFDDIEAGWNQYSFNKLFTPAAAGEGTEGQLTRSRKLAYVCFSRAQMNLRIFLYCPNPIASYCELISSGLLEENQVQILQ